MATYINGVTDYVPQIQQFTPDYNFNQSVLTVKQQKYDQGLQQVSSLYGSALDMDLTRDDNQIKKQEFFKDIDKGIKKLAGLDLSLRQNIEQAYGLFNQFLNDKEIQHDAMFTKVSKDELQKAQAFKNCLNPDECGGEWWEGGERLIQLSMMEYKDASAEDALNMTPQEFVPAQNVWKIATDIMKEIDPDKTVEYIDESKTFIVKDKNGEVVTGEVSALLTGILGSDQRIQQYYKAKAKLDRLEFVNANKDKFGSESIANAAYYGLAMQDLEQNLKLQIAYQKGNLSNAKDTEQKSAIENTLLGLYNELNDLRNKNSFLLGLANAINGNQQVPLSTNINNALGNEQGKTSVQTQIEKYMLKANALETAISTVSSWYELAKQNRQYTDGYSTDILDAEIGNTLFMSEIQQMTMPLSYIWSTESIKGWKPEKHGSSVGGYTWTFKQQLGRGSSLSIKGSGNVSSNILNNNKNSNSSQSSSQSRGSGPIRKFGGQLPKYQIEGEVKNKRKEQYPFGNIGEGEYPADYPNLYPQFSISENLKGNYNLITTNEPWKTNQDYESPLKYDEWISTQYDAEEETGATKSNPLYATVNGQYVTYQSKEKIFGVKDEQTGNIYGGHFDLMYNEFFGISRKAFDLAYYGGIISPDIYYGNAYKGVYNDLSKKNTDLKLFLTPAEQNINDYGQAGVTNNFDAVGYSGSQFLWENQRQYLIEHFTDIRNQLNNFLSAQPSNQSNGGLLYRIRSLDDGDNLLTSFKKAFNYEEMLDVLDYNINELKKTNVVPNLKSFEETFTEQQMSLIDETLKLLYNDNELPSAFELFGIKHNLLKEIEISKSMLSKLHEDVRTVIRQTEQPIYQKIKELNIQDYGNVNLGIQGGTITGIALGSEGGPVGMGIGAIVGGALGGIMFGFRESEKQLLPSDRYKLGLINNFVNYNDANDSNTFNLLFSSVPNYKLYMKSDNIFSEYSNALNEDFSSDENMKMEKSVGLTPLELTLAVKSLYPSSEVDVHMYANDIITAYNSACKQLNCGSIDINSSTGNVIINDLHYTNTDGKEALVSIEFDPFGPEDDLVKSVQLKTKQTVRKPLRVPLSETEILPGQNYNPETNEEYNYDVFESSNPEDIKMVTDAIDISELKRQLFEYSNYELNFGYLLGVASDLDNMMKNKDKRRDYTGFEIFSNYIEKDDEDEDTSYSHELIGDCWTRFFGQFWGESSLFELPEKSSVLETFGKTFVCEYPRICEYNDGSKSSVFTINKDQEIRSILFDELFKTAAIENKEVTNTPVFAIKVKNTNDGGNTIWPKLNEDGEADDNSQYINSNATTLLNKFRFDNYKDDKSFDKNVLVYVTPIANNDQRYIGFSIMRKDSKPFTEEIDGKKEDFKAYTFYIPFEKIKDIELADIYRDNTIINWVKLSNGKLRLDASSYSSDFKLEKENDVWNITNNAYLNQVRPIQNPETSIQGSYSRFDIPVININNDVLPDVAGQVQNVTALRSGNVNMSDEDLALFILRLEKNILLNNKITLLNLTRR